VGGGDDESESGMSSGGCLSQPSSPSLSGRLGRVTRLISRSDANLVHSLKVRWVWVICPVFECSKSMLSVVGLKHEMGLKTFGLSLTKLCLNVIYVNVFIQICCGHFLKRNELVLT
jgi:hypothetical protein